MPISTNLGIRPYYDDYNPNKDYYRILFKPSTAVQVREMNQLQSMLQHQIEEFGDHILKKGTVLSGCQVTYSASVPYIKLLDQTENGSATDVKAYQGLRLIGEDNGVEASIINYSAGLESSDPNLNTLYLKYLTGGTAGSTKQFVGNEVVKVFSQERRLYDLNVIAASAGFSNNDQVVILSAIEVVTTGATGGTNDFANTFADDEELVDDLVTPTIRVVVNGPQIVNNDNNTIELSIRPALADLDGSLVGRQKFENIEERLTTLIGTVSGNECQVVKKIGSGATGRIVTTRTGQIAAAQITRGGQNYTSLPYVTINSLTATSSQISALDIEAQEYLTRLRIAAEAFYSNPTGFGFFAAIGSGKIYQKGHFLRTDAQNVIVSKYSNTPSDLSIGFETTEAIINVFTDSTLYDNAADFLNFRAPGANRLQLKPKLVVRTEIEEQSDSNYQALVRFSSGLPYQQNKMTQYEKIGDMIAQRTFEESGNYSLDEFKLVTKSTQSIANSDTDFTYVIDPGHAYINGYRVRTVANFSKKISKGLDVLSETLVGTDLEYDNYIIVDNFYGYHEFKDASQIEFYDNAYTLANPYDTPTLSGTATGTARIRSVTLNSGIQGTSSARYKIYLFDIKMNAGKNFKKNVKAIKTEPSSGPIGFGNVVLSSGNEFVLRTLKTDANQSDANGTPIPLSYTQLANIVRPRKSSLIVRTGRATTIDGSAYSNINYKYRTSVVNITAGGTGIITLNAVGSDKFPYIGSLTDAEEKELILIPQVDIVTANVETGMTSGSAGSPNGDGTTTISWSAGPTFSSTLRAGDFITDGTNTAQIVSVVGNETLKVVTQSASYPTGANLARKYPTGYPIDLSRSNITVTQVGTNVLNVQLDVGLTGGSDVTTAITAIFNQKVVNTTSVIGLTPERKVYVTVSVPATGFPENGLTLGVPGIFRLRNVYQGSTTAGSNITQRFVLDAGHNDNYWGLGRLVTKNSTSSGRTLSNLAGQTLLVEFDYYSPGARGGLKTVDSYSINDETALSALTSGGVNVNSAEIPAFSNKAGQFYDLRECLDFRPFADINVTPDANPASAPGVIQATDSVVTFASATGLKFPVPQGDLVYDINHYEGRIDEIYVNSDGKFTIVQDNINAQKKNESNSILLYRTLIPPYPSYPEVLSGDMLEIINTNINNGSNPQAKRVSKYSITKRKVDAQVRRYTMEEINKLEARIAALENNQNLALLENSVTNRTIQSSVDSTLDRFKFGFFVDNFANYRFTNKQSPEYNASIYDYVLQPAKSVSNLQYKLDSTSSPYLQGNKIVFPYRSRRLLSQTYATYGPFPPPQVEPNIIEACQFVSSRNRRNIGDSAAAYTVLEDAWEEATFVGADFSDNTTRKIEIRFYNPTQVAFEVIQSTKPPTAANKEDGISVFNPRTSTPTTLSSPEAIALYKKLYPVRDNRSRVVSFNQNPWFTDQTSGTFTVSGDGGGTFNTVVGAGKIQINYDHTKGKYITVRAIKKGEVFNYEICYPVITTADAVFDTGVTELDITPPPPEEGTFLYTKCEGTTLIRYVADGNGGEKVGSRIKNSIKCGYIEPIICPTGYKIENGKCVEIIITPEPCPPGTIRDPATNKCIEIVDPPPVPCQDGFERNPITGKCEPIIVVEPPPPANPCEELAGQIYQVKCSTGPDKTQTTYKYTGDENPNYGELAFSGSQPQLKCAIEEALVIVNSPDCGYVVEEPPEKDPVEEPPEQDPDVISDPPEEEPATEEPGNEEQCLTFSGESCVKEEGPKPEDETEKENPDEEVGTDPVLPPDPPPDPVEEEPIVKEDPEEPPPPAPPPPPSGGGCVHYDSYLPNSVGSKKAYEYNVGDELIIGHEDLSNSVGEIEQIMTQPEPCVRIVTENNITLVCSTSAPIWTSEGRYYDAPELTGKQVAVMKDGKTWFDNVVNIEEIGVLDVRPLNVGDRNFWAGEKDGEYIMHHNVPIRDDIMYTEKH